VDLYLVRHAIAEQRHPGRWPDDSSRPLSPDGADRFRRAARGLRRLRARVDAVLASSYARAWETAEILEQEAGWPSPEAFHALEPPSTATACLGRLRPRSDASLALVGHQPQLSHLASLLLSAREDDVRVELRKGGVACITTPDGLAPGSGILRWSASPRILRRIGG
jgi:phosphohistidine phosphatase